METAAFNHPAGVEKTSHQPEEGPNTEPQTMNRQHHEAAAETTKYCTTQHSIQIMKRKQQPTNIKQQ